MLSREALKILPTLTILLVSFALALNALYGEGSPLLEDTGDVEQGNDGVVLYVEGFKTFGLSCGTLLSAALGDIRASDYEDVP